MDIKKLFDQKSLKNLDLGQDPQKGFVSLGDLKWHFDKLPYPIPDASVDLVRAENILEKVKREDRYFLNFMDEVWRILKYDGQFVIATVYAGSHLYYQDPLNVNPLVENSFAYFDPIEPVTKGALYRIYKPKPWKIMALSFKVNGIMEVLLEKRRIDKSYG